MEHQQPKFKLGDVVYTVGRKPVTKICRHCGSYYDILSEWKVFDTPLYVGGVRTSCIPDCETGEPVFSVLYTLFVECDKNDPRYNNDLADRNKAEKDIFTKEEVDAGFAQAECDKRNDNNQ